MAFFEDFGKKVSKAAQAAAKKSGELVEITKLNANISAQEDSIKKCYIKMGEMCFEKFRGNQLQDNELLTVCNEIVGYQEKITELRGKIDEIKAQGQGEQAAAPVEAAQTTEEAASTSVSLDKPTE